VTQSTWTPIAARLKNRLETVSGVGKVHDHLELATTGEELIAMGAITVDGEQRIRVWMISLEQGPARWAEQGGGTDWTRRAVIEGFLQYEAAGAAEKKAIALAESIIRVLNVDLAAKPSLNGTVLSGGPAALEACEPRAFGPLFCHYIRISIPLFTVESP